MSPVAEHHLGRLAERSYERKGNYRSLLFEGRWHESGELFARSQRLAAGLGESGLSAGERVVVTMANCPEVAIVYQALWRAGAVVTAANFLLSPTELRHVIADAQACAVVTTPEFLDKVHRAVAGLPSVRLVLCSEDSDGALALAELEQAAPAPIVARHESDLAALLYTGGTTGRSKGVMLSHSNLYFSGRCAHEAAYVPGLNRALTTLPLSHAYGLLVTIAALHHPEPGVSVLLRWFDPTAFLAGIEGRYCSFRG